jgi:signal transduction histidine kinase
VWVSLQESNGSVALEVRDDGVGFPPVSAGRHRPIGAEDHIGLIAMRERVEGAGGTWELRSRPGDGTTVRAVFPRHRDLAPAGRLAGP